MPALRWTPGESGRGRWGPYWLGPVHRQGEPDLSTRLCQYVVSCTLKRRLGTFAVQLQHQSSMSCRQQKKRSCISVPHLLAAHCTGV